MLALAVAAFASALVIGGMPAPEPIPTAVAAVPDEPGVVVLPDGRPTVQAVAADLDGDGVRDVVRLVGGSDGALLAEAWREDGSRWVQAASPAIAVAGSGGQAEAAYLGRPVRLLVRRVPGGERVTLLRQPDFTDPGSDAGCCLLLDDLRLLDGTLRVESVSEPDAVADAVHVIDLDGDGTDELLATRSLPPLGDISYPTDARVFRWAGDRFGAPTSTELPIGSGDTPFVLGDSDGLPGEEAAIISVAGRADLFRISLAEGDALRVEEAGLIASDARAVPLGEGRGLAILGPVVGLAVMPWPSGSALGPAVADLPVERGRLLGVVDILDEPRLLLRQTDPEALHVLGLPSLTPPRGGSITRSPAAAALAGGPLAPYVGPLPGGGLDGAPAVIYAGRLLPSDDLPDAAFATRQAALTATLAGSEPIGLVGGDHRWLAIRHAPAATPLDPRGGRLDPPDAAAGSLVSLAPIDVARTPEADGGALELAVEAATLPNGELVVGRDGFVVDVVAPPGSRVYVAGPDPSMPGRGREVDAGGRLRAVVTAPNDVPGNARYRASVALVTPAGHAYATHWSVRVLVQPPALVASVSTGFGSAEVTVEGRTAPYADVVVAGNRVAVGEDGRFSAAIALPPWPTPIRVTAADPAGNEAVTVLSGVGLFDYRALPWVPIVVALVAAAAVALALRVPQPRPDARPITDDAMLEELDPDGPA